MNSSSAVYASSLFSLAKDENRINAIMTDIKIMSECFCENQEYSSLLDSPVVPLTERLSLIDEAFSGLCDYAVNFLKILCEKKLVHIFSDCVKLYEKLYYKENNIEKVTVITAVDLDDNLREKLVKKLEAEYQKTIVAEYRVDKNIIGGIIVQTENSQTDASVRARLDTIKAQIGKVK